MSTAVIITLIICATLIVLMVLGNKIPNSNAQEAIDGITDSLIELSDKILKPMAVDLGALKHNDRITKELVSKIVLALQKANIEIDGVEIHAVRIEEGCDDVASDEKETKKTTKKKTAKNDKCETESVDCQSK